MEIKYYTPSVEEFHIGFEYEWLDEDKTWKKESTPTEISVKGYNDQTYGLRVKYLDKEDIESLGFKEIHLKWHFAKVIDNDTYMIDPYFHMVPSERENLVRILRVDPESYARETVLFSGDIKNKSELKQVLKMLRLE